MFYLVQKMHFLKIIATLILTIQSECSDTKSFDYKLKFLGMNEKMHQSKTVMSHKKVQYANSLASTKYFDLSFA